MAFLPVDRPTTSAGSYFKPQDGDNRIRILSDAVVGFVYWTNDNKPIRTRTEPKHTPNIRIGEDGKADRIKLFWAMKVWNYANSEIQIWEMTQRTIQDQIESLADDEDWGHPREYDLKINKSGSRLDTKYSVIAAPKKAIAPEIEAALAESTINLQSIFSDSENATDDPQSGTNSTFEKFEGMLNRAASAKQVDMAIQWASSSKQLPKMVEVFGENAVAEIAAVGKARKTELNQPGEDYEDIPF